MCEISSINNVTSESPWIIEWNEKKTNLKNNLKDKYTILEIHNRNFDILNSEDELVNFFQLTFYELPPKKIIVDKINKGLKEIENLNNQIYKVSLKLFFSFNFFKS